MLGGCGAVVVMLIKVFLYIQCLIYGSFLYFISVDELPPFLVLFIQLLFILLLLYFFQLLQIDLLLGLEEVEEHEVFVLKSHLHLALNDEVEILSEVSFLDYDIA
jgi:hypothetical protein